MNRVLILAYYYPPMGMGGVQRTVKFAKYLPEFGWEPTVLTVKDVLYHATDDSFEEDVKAVRTVRTESLDPLRLAARWAGRRSPKDSDRTSVRRVYGWMSRWMSVPDPKILWGPYAVRKALDLVSRNHFRILLTTAPPHSAHLMGRHLRRRTGIPWVADFRDDWLGMYFGDFPTRVHGGLNRWMARRILGAADGSVVVSEPIRDGFREEFGSALRCEVIPNGYDRQDFEGIEKTKTRSRFTVAYCGTLSPLLNPEVFLKGTARAVELRPELRSRLRVRLTGGVVGLDLRAMIDGLGLGDIVRREGYVSHRESVLRLLDSDLLLLILPGSVSGGLVTGKVYEYLASGKPILALAPCGVDARLVIDHARGVVVPPGDAEGVAGRLLRSFELWLRGDLKLTRPRWQGIEPYERRSLTERLARFLDSIHDSCESRTSPKTCQRFPVSVV